MIKGRTDFSAQDGLQNALWMIPIADTGSCRQAFDALKISMLDGHDSMFCKYFLWIIVNELAVDENINSMVTDANTLCCHFLLLSDFNFGHFCQTGNFDTRAIDLDLIGVHCCVSDHHLGIFHAPRLTNPYFFIKHKAFCKVRITKRATRLLDQLNVV